MTFVFKDIPALKRELDRLIAAYNQESVQKIHEPRRSEILYLSAILSAIEVPAKKHLDELSRLSAIHAELPQRRLKLEAPAADATPELKAKFAEENAKLDELMAKLPEDMAKAKAKYEDLLSVYYGAMLVAREHSGDLHGKLSLNIAEAVGIDAKTKPENRPTLYHTARFLYAVNAFLQYSLYPQDRSIAQFNPKHLFSSSTSVRKAQLEELMVTGFKLEAKTQQELYAAFAPIESSATPTYELKKLTYAPTLKTIPDWKTLRTNLEELIRAEIKYWKVSTVSQLNDTRKAQIYFLQKIEALLLTQDIALPEAETKSLDAGQLAAAKDSERAAVLAGSMLLIYRDIYPKTWIGSTVCDEVERILHVSKMSSPDAEVLALAANSYLRSASLIEVPESLQSKGFPKAIRANNPFTTALDANDKCIITPAELKALTDVSNTHICEMRSDRLEKIMPTLAYTDTPVVEQAPSLLSGLSAALSGYSIFGTKSKAPTVPAAVVAEAAASDATTSTVPTMGGVI